MPLSDERQRYVEHQNKVANQPPEEKKPVNRNVAIALMVLFIVATCLTVLLTMYLIMNNGRF